MTPCDTDRPTIDRSHVLATALLITIGGLTATSVGAASATDTGTRPISERPVIAASGNTGWTTPTRPPNCSRSQALSGDVSGCIVTARGRPAERGWGDAPNPAVTPGFRFGGWSYHGPGVDAFAAEHLTTNTVPVAGRVPGTLRTHVAAAALFEGFLDEIHHAGYPIHDAIGFVYRCTSGSGGDCASGSMSNHAWGLAVDINPGPNPERTYHAIGDTSACAVPQQTDIPRWVVETAERWGLFWGGYGWSSGGCRSPDDWSDRVRRDPHHFEFRGTVDMALAIAAHNGRPQRPMGCHPIVNARRDVVTACSNSGVPAAGTRSPVEIDAPGDAVAAIVTITATDAAEPGFVTAESCREDLDAERSTSNTNVEPGRAAANTAIVPIRRGEPICVWRSTSSHTVVDVVGHLVTGGDDVVRLRPVEPRRAADTRTTGHCPAGTVDCAPGRPPAGSVHSYPLDALDGAGAGGAMVNVTAVGSDAAGYLTADRCERLSAAEPGTSTVNHGPSEARANLTFVTSDTTSAVSCVRTSATGHVAVDVVAGLDQDGLGAVPADARRLLDTRACTTDPCPPVPAGSVVPVPGTGHATNDGPVGRAGAVVNVTVTGSATGGFVTIDACDRLTPGEAPETSTVNVAAGGTAANLAVTAGGPACLYTSSDAHLVVDLQAWLTDDGGGAGIRLVEPARRLDTRG